ncbi:hypothetical protein V8G54_022484 [Vigna mungo]|uniref:SWIM-type domain-containing protein n=1 Tax=Vigna mungo TaxID=3915 RepID=A0AAQ3N3H6_VIGMU
MSKRISLSGKVGVTSDLLLVVLPTEKSMLVTSSSYYHCAYMKFRHVSNQTEYVIKKLKKKDNVECKEKLSVIVEENFEMILFPSLDSLVAQSPFANFPQKKLASLEFLMGRFWVEMIKRNSKEAAISGKQLANGECVTTEKGEEVEDKEIRNNNGLPQERKRRGAASEKRKRPQEKMEKRKTISETECREEDVHDSCDGAPTSIMMNIITYRHIDVGALISRRLCPSSRKRRLFTTRRLSARESGESINCSPIEFYSKQSKEFKQGGRCGGCERNGGCEKQAKFVKNKGLHYVGGEIHVIKGENNEEVEIYVQHVSSEVVEVQFLTCGEEADEGHIKEMEEEVSKVGDEEVNLHEEEMPEKESYGGEEQDNGGHDEGVEEVGMGLEDGDGDEEHDSDVNVVVQEVEIGGEQDSNLNLAVEDVEMSEEEGDGVEQQDSHVYVAVEKVAMGKEKGDGGKEQEEVNLEEGYVGEEHDYLHEEEEGGNVVEEEVEALAVECLDDSEKERMTNDDDGFSIENDRVDKNEKKEKKSVSRINNVGEGSFIMNEEVGQHDINEEYNSDELDLDVDSDDGVRLKRGKFRKYRQDARNKSFKFELGMEFCSLKEFKNALLEHGVLNGKKVKFVKNDLNRVRVVCKNKCGFLIMASKGQNPGWTSQMWKGFWKQKCKFTLDCTSISRQKAGKAKQIALDSLVGDGERQHGCLYDYVGELLRGCKQDFLSSCRSFIGVDDCHLKTTYGSQLLVTVARDPNDQYFPLAFDVRSYDGGCQCHISTGVGKENGEVENSGNWIPVWVGAAKFEVTHDFIMDKFIVDLSNHTCSCYFWDLVGIPCRHVVSAINYKLENPEDYVHPYYKKQAYETCYGPEIVPINGQQLWYTSDSTALLPPIYKTPLGRPKKLRRREPDEYVSHTKLSKKNLVMKCNSCNQFVIM